MALLLHPRFLSHGNSSLVLSLSLSLHTSLLLSFQIFKFTPSYIDNEYLLVRVYNIMISKFYELLVSSLLSPAQHRALIRYEI